MTYGSILDLIPEIITRTARDGGATIDPKSLSFIKPKDLWYYPKYPSLTQIADASELSSEMETFLASNFQRLHEGNVVLGTWMNPQTGKIYIDINTYNSNKQAAQKDAKERSVKDGRRIVSMYNPYLLSTEYIIH